MKRGILPLLLVALMMTGCTGTTSTAEPTPTPTVPANYPTVLALKDAYVAAGGSCSGWNPSNAVKIAAESADCDGSTVLSVYISQSTRDQSVANLESVSDSVHLLVGGNWIINMKSPTTFQPKLGGTVVTK